MIAPGDLAVVFGPPGEGKSVLAPFLARAIAVGRSVFGRPVRDAPVLYVAAEDGAGLRMRAEALHAVLGAAEGALPVIESIDLQGHGLSEPADLARIFQAAHAIRAGMVVVDTLAAAFPGLGENDGRAMGRAVAILRKLTTGSRAVLPVHHGVKGDGSTPRGHGVLNGAADVTMRLDPAKQRGEPWQVWLGKNRNGSSFGGFAFKIRGQTIGRDEDGDEISAPIAEKVMEEGGAWAACMMRSWRPTTSHLARGSSWAGRTCPS